MRGRSFIAAMTGLVAVGVTTTAHAFCGFYVSGADASLYNDATMVAMMREGTRTVLSMQNNYRGPAEDFALVIPVPEVLQEENVKTLDREIFARLDQLAAPRLVEYWEMDPCYVEPEYDEESMAEEMPAPTAAAMDDMAGADLGVRVEATFAVGEYDIVVLSAEDSGGLDTWLRQNDYNIPQGAEPVLRPYVEAATKFFVAKVDPERVTFQNGQAVLSPLRVHYDSETFSLPVRLGLLNSDGEQDLIVHILAPSQRYEVANYANAFIPTNIRVHDDVRNHFGSFYDALFEGVRGQNRNTVVTEYAWQAQSCDPCPTPPLDQSELQTLGADVLEQTGNFTLTRLHYRYDREGLEEDLVFREAPSVVGGRGMPTREGELGEKEASESSYDNFQGRYVILHPWEGELECDEPYRGRWGGPPGQGFGAPPPQPRAARNPNLTAAPTPSGPVPSLAALVAEDVPAAGVEAERAGETPETVQARTSSRSSESNSSGGCAGCSAGGTGGGLALLVLVGLLGLRRRS